MRSVKPYKADMKSLHNDLFQSHSLTCYPQFRPEMLDTLYSFAKFQYECGNYSGAADYLYLHRGLVPISDKVLQDIPPSVFKASLGTAQFSTSYKCLYTCLFLWFCSVLVATLHSAQTLATSVQGQGWLVV